MREVLVALSSGPANAAAAGAEPASGTLPLRAPEPGTVAAAAQLRAPETADAAARLRAPEPDAFGAADQPVVAGAARPSRPAVEPLDAAHARLHLTVSRRLLEKLQAAKDALSHARPGVSTEEILEAGLDLILAERAKRRGLVEKPRNVARPAKIGAVPTHVKREAWRRAGGRCEFRLDSGEVCGSTKPRARPRDPAGARRAVHDRQRPGHVSRAQRPRRAPGVRGRVDGWVPAGRAPGAEM